LAFALPRNAPTVAWVGYSLAIALMLGLGTAYWSVKGAYPLGRTEAQGWTAWPKVGARDIDPYARAILARTGDIPLALGEGVALLADADQDGRPLDARCSYRIAGTTPVARYWTLTLSDAAGRPVATDLGRSGFTSAEVLRDAEGRFEIAISRAPAPGNWLQTPPSGRLRATLRLYDTPVGGSLAWLDPGSLPTVRREACAP